VKRLIQRGRDLWLILIWKGSLNSLRFEKRERVFGISM
jgi:hypothetical protein